MSRPGLSAAALALVCPALVALGLPRAAAWPFAWLCFAPLLLSWRRLSGSQVFLAGWLAGAACNATILQWIYTTCRVAGLGVGVALLAWGSLSVFLGLSWGLSAWLGTRLADGLPAPARPWAWALVWTAVNAACEAWTPRLAVDLLCYTQYANPALVQVGALAGPHALCFLIILVNAGLAEAWEAAQGGERTEGLALSVAAALALVAAAWGYGTYALAGRLRFRPGPAVRVEILQPAVDQYQKWDAGTADRVIANFDELLSLPRPAAPALVVWPESAIPRWVEEGEDIPESSRWAKKLAAYQVVGAVSRGPGASHCAAFLLGPDGRLRQTYFKRQLVPFGEFQPIPYLERYIGILSQMGGLSPGAPLQTLWETPLGRSAMSICYEAVFPRWARRDAARGARVLINITNDAWYMDTWGPHQHMVANAFRAVENRVFVVRSGNTGISGVIDPWGVIISQLDLERRGRLDAEVPLEDPFPRRSLYARAGDWLALLCLAATALLAVRRLSARPAR